MEMGYTEAMNIRGPLFYRLIGLAAVLVAAASGAFFLILIPLVAGRDPKAAGVLLVAGIAGFGLAVLVLPALILYIFLKKPKQE